jgi:GNAT superfamily N-acetyltransferase
MRRHHGFRNTIFPAFGSLEDSPVKRFSSRSRGEKFTLDLVGETPAGTLTLQWADPVFWGEMPPDAGYVHKLAVRPTYAGQKIGLEMLRWAEATARKAGKRFLRLNCLAEDMKIRDYYEHAGFLYKGNVAGPKAMATLYEKVL